MMELIIQLECLLSCQVLWTYLLVLQDEGRGEQGGKEATRNKAYLNFAS